ncbi:class I SAM-dependent methyltransferase [Ensifer aridi]|uniref:class I SAM-dependent methyltransferase n=1 Tax=Ensifer aridi TaxID=1708715 RepID=UPI00111C837E|nr:class I SAM-dependent methyltransferase [Ensifer aridi]
MFEKAFEALSEGASRFHRERIVVTSEAEALAVIKETLGALEGDVDISARDEMHKHCLYLAEKAGLTLPDLRSAETVEVAPQVFEDALTNISAVLLSARPSGNAENAPDIVEQIIRASGAELEGWCSPEKARTMARYIRELRPSVCVEIGVYGGRSLFPCAAALKENGHGRIFGIESWSTDVAVENKTSEGNDAWWGNVDFSRIKKSVYSFVARHDLTNQVCILEASSTKASHLFDTIDFLHIDGSHSMINAATDVILYATKVRSGGIIIMDDIEWHTTIPAYTLLRSFCDELQVLENPANGKPSAAFLRKH